LPLTEAVAVKITQDCLDCAAGDELTVDDVMDVDKQSSPQSQRVGFG